MKVAYEAFDKNRGAGAILDIKPFYQDAVVTGKCDTLPAVGLKGGLTTGAKYEMLTNLYTFPAMEEGCYDGTKVTKGACTGTLAETGTKLAARNSVVLNHYWGSRICVLRTKSHTLRVNA